MSPIGGYFQDLANKWLPDEEAIYTRQMRQVREETYQATAQMLHDDYGQQRWKSLDLLREVAQQERNRCSENHDRLADNEAGRFPSLSSDDWMHAARIGANKAIQDWYFEQKREHGLGRAADQRKVIGLQAERAAMQSTLHRIEMGEVAPREIPPDVANYYRRIQEIDRAIERSQQLLMNTKEKEKTVSQGKDPEKELEKYFKTQKRPLRPLEEEWQNIQNFRQANQHLSPEESLEKYANEVMAHQDWRDELLREIISGIGNGSSEYEPVAERRLQAYERENPTLTAEQLYAKWMAGKAVAHTAEQSVTNDNVRSQGYVSDKAFIDTYLTPRQQQLQREWRELSVSSAVEAGAATNYYRGRAEEFNCLRQSFLEAHPGMEKEMPTAIQVDEIRVRQQAIEQEREQQKGMAIAR